jgi:hypothetical protein
MNDELQRYRDPRLGELLEREETLAAQVEGLRLSFSGLADVDQLLELAAVRLEAANRLLELPGGLGPEAGPARPGGGDGSGESPEAGLARRLAQAALRQLEVLRAANVSEDQRSLVAEAPGYARARELFQEFLLRGGAALLEERVGDDRRLKVLARAVSESIRKHAIDDDRYEPVFRTERLPRRLRALVNLFLPVLARENQQDPPCGIEEGEEQLLWSERMKMPLSQAIHYLTHEVAPRLRERLAAEPGSPALQRELFLLEDRLREYRAISLRPRATPINLEKGFYTDWYSSFTGDGELLVSVALPVISRSGTRLDRLRELVQQEIVRRLAGRGVCPDIDADYRFRRSLESGRLGSSRLPGFRLDYGRGFQALKSLYPAMSRLEDRGEFARLVDEVRRSGRRGGARAAERLLARDPQDLPRLP